MNTSATVKPRFGLVSTVVVLSPVLWWCSTLTVGALGIWWQSIGDVVVTWNIDIAIGLILLIPAAIFVFNGVSDASLPTTFRRGRCYVTAGLALTSLFCVLGIVGALDKPEYRDPNSWSPELSGEERWIVAVPYSVFLVSACLTIRWVWRHRPVGFVSP